MDSKAAAPGQDVPPAYTPGDNPSQPMPAAHLPGQSNQHQPPIAMQPVGQPRMATTGGGETVTPLNLLSEKPQWVDCQMCQQRTRTRVEQKGEGMQFLTGFLLCLVCICLAPLPCCLHWFEQTNWYCEKCGKQIATRTHETPVQVLPPPHALSVPSQYAAQPGAAPPAGYPPVGGGPGAMPAGSPPPVASPGAPVGVPPPVEITQAPAQLPEQPPPVKN